MTPEQLRSQTDTIAAQAQADIVRREITFNSRLNAACCLFPLLLDKWFDRHRNEWMETDPPEDDCISYRAPTPNDLRWLAKLAYHYGAFVPEAAGLTRIDNERLADILAGINPQDLFSFPPLDSKP